MSNQQEVKPYDIAEDKQTEKLRIVAFGGIVENTPTFAPDAMQAARQYCDVLNTAYNDGVARKGMAGEPVDEDPGYNTMTRNGP
jgi:hypothetical protein